MLDGNPFFVDEVVCDICQELSKSPRGRPYGMILLERRLKPGENRDADLICTSYHSSSGHL